MRDDNKPGTLLSPEDSPGQLQYISLLKDKNKFRILMLLLVYRELNVTEISNILHQSKATISRHLKEMEGVIVEYKEAFKGKDIKGRITPKYYRVRDEFFKKIKPLDADQAPEGDEERYYRDAIELIRSCMEISKESLDLIDPMLSYIESEMDGPEKSAELFSSILLKRQFYLDMYWFSDEQYAQFIKYLQEFRQKTDELFACPPLDAPQPYVYIGSLVHMGKLLEFQALMRERKRRDSDMEK
jgi:DNA-binding transcriptional ArsR family regulator